MNKSTVTPQFQLPKKSTLLGRSGWTALVAAVIVLCAVVPVLNLLVPPSSVFHLSDFAVTLVGKVMC